jgi:hypothetical protein
MTDSFVKQGRKQQKETDDLSPASIEIMTLMDNLL